MKQVLIVDDHISVRELIRVILENLPYVILQATNGSEALEIVRAENPDLILLDIMMPNGPDGLEVCRTLKNDPATADIIIVMLTIKGQKTDVEQGFAAGADEYLIKPFGALKLMKTLRERLGE